MKETDKEFVERVALDVQVHGDIYGFDRPRLVTLARRGAEASEASNLRGMVRHHQDQNTALRAEIERLRAALRECEVELDAYYRAEYPGDHPYSIKKLKEAMASNPARAALKEDGDE